MPMSGTLREVHRLARARHAGAIVVAEQAVDAGVAAYARSGDGSAALDILLRDLTRLRSREPALDGFIGEVEGYIDLLSRDLARRASARHSA